MKTFKKKKINYFIEKFFTNRTYFVLFCILFVVLIVTRFIMPETKSGFGYDQVDNAWAAKDILIDGKLPLVGMQAKGNTGFYIGPYYYYFLAPFYFVTAMDPIASPIAALVVAIFTFFVVYFVTKSMFGEKAALIAIFINTFSSYILILDRVQWPVDFIVPISFLVLFSLYQILNNKPKYLILLAASVGFSLHIHFTSVFYGLLILLALPFFPRTKKLLKPLAISIPIFIFFVFPIILNYILTKQAATATTYLGSTFHGFHLRRVAQLMKDAVIEFNSILTIPYAHFVSFASIPIAVYLFLKGKIERKNVLFLYLSLIWIVVPWFAFSTYSGELTNYYFAITRPIAILIFSYIILRLINTKKIYVYCLLGIVGIYYIYINTIIFIDQGPQSLSMHKKIVKDKMAKGEKVEFVQGDPQSYLYYLYTTLKH